jgi:hypothetical protein
MSDRAAAGKRRAEPPRKRRRRGRDPKPGGRRADRPENHEGITPEFLQQMRELEAEPPSWSDAGIRAAPVRTGPGPREILAGIDADLRGDQAYQQALSRLAYG